MNLYDLLRRLTEVSNMYPEEKRTAGELIGKLQGASALGTMTSETSQDQECQHDIRLCWLSSGSAAWERGPGIRMCIKCGKQEI